MVGDSVLLDTRHLDLAHLGTDGKQKRVARYIDPYPIMSVTGPDAYKLELPHGLRLHPAFHVSRLQRYHRDDHADRITRVPPVLVADGTEGHLVAAVIGHCTRKRVRNFKVRWLDTSIAPYWEPLTNLGQVVGLIRQYLDMLPPTRAIARLSEEVSRV